MKFLLLVIVLVYLVFRTSRSTYVDPSEGCAKYHVAQGDWSEYCEEVYGEHPELVYRHSPGPN